MIQGRFMGRVIWLFIPLAILAVVAGALSYLSETRRIHGEAAERGRRMVTMTESKLEPLVGELAKDALYLARSHALQELLNGKVAGSLESLQGDWRAFSETRSVYDQIRWIDETGQERVRINFGSAGAVVVPESDLQYKGDRYYFTEAVKLRPGEVFVSPLDLNIEGGVVELPWKPMIRFATPVFDDAGGTRGVVVVNYLAGGLLANLAPTDRAALWLTNQEGYWLRGPNPAEDWGFMFQRPELTIGQRYPEVWARIRQAASGTFETEEGLWNFATVESPLPGSAGDSLAGAQIPLPAAARVRVAERTWKLIHLTPRSALTAALIHSRVVFGGMTSLLLLALLAGAWRVARSMVAEARAKEALERANLELEGRVSARTRELSSEVEARRKSEAMLEYQATHDALTGLANRAQMEACFEQAVAASQPGAGRVALAFLDLDNFKVVNDSLGHGRGDELLTCVAHRLTHAARQSDFVARYGGDEFVLILQSPRGIHDLETILARLLRSLEPPVMLGEHPVKVSCSVGVAIYPDDAEDWHTLLRAADMALYKAKDSGKGQFQLYSRDLDRASQARFSYENALRAALERGEISPHFQPKLDAEGRLTGFEALARWHSPELGQVPPDRFIPVAESSGLILPLGWQVLRLACAEAATWVVDEGPPPGVAVNLSPKQLASPELMNEIRRALAESGLPPERLELEITESMLMGDIQRTIQVLGDIRAMGIRIAVDDFGTGYSSLSYLRRLPLDVLKIDRSFVDECERSGEFMAIPHAIIFIGKTLNLRIVAEGVEKREQFEVLHLCGCDEFQGYLISKPMSATETRRFIASGVRGARERLGLPSPAPERLRA